MHRRLAALVAALVLAAGMSAGAYHLGGGITAWESAGGEVSPVDP